MYFQKRYHHVWNRQPEIDGEEEEREGEDEDDEQEEAKPLRTRPDSHFPEILLWVPSVFFNAYMSAYFGSRDLSLLTVTSLPPPSTDSVPTPVPGYQLTQKNILQIVTIGGIIVSPLFTILMPVIFGVVLPTSTKFCHGVVFDEERLRTTARRRRKGEKRRRKACMHGFTDSSRCSAGL